MGNEWISSEPESTRAFFSVQMLDAIDSKRMDGIFCGNLQHVPAGQARAAEILQANYSAVGIKIAPYLSELPECK